MKLDFLLHRITAPHLFYLFRTLPSANAIMRGVIKFIDDSVIVSFLSSDDPERGSAVGEFTDWCKASILDINVSKTKENPTVVSPVQINDQAVEFVLQYKNLAPVLDDVLCKCCV